MIFKILTFNMHHGRGIDGKLNLERIARIIKESDADFVGLNEVDQNFSWRSNNADQLRWLQEELHMEGAFGEAIIRKGPKEKAYGNGLLSKFPIISKENHLVSYPYWFQENRSILISEVKIGSKRLTLFVTHLSLNKKLQTKHINQLLKLIEMKKIERYIIVGDFNMSDRGFHYNTIAKRCLDAASERGKKEPTFPSVFSRKRLDYVWTSKNGLEIVDIKVLKKDPLASDHLPLLVEIKLI